MEAQERYRLKEILRKSRIAKHKKYLSKVERSAVIEGYLALKKLGIYNQPKYACDRKEPPRPKYNP